VILYFSNYVSYGMDEHPCKLSKRNRGSSVDLLVNYTRCIALFLDIGSGLFKVAHVFATFSRISMRDMHFGIRQDTREPPLQS
jgi:hypothetical protein